MKSILCASGAFLLSLVVGCSASTDDVTSNTDQLKTSATVALAGQTVNYPAQTAIAGVQVCVDTDCQTTGADGKYSFEVPVNTDAHLTFAGTGWLPVNHFIHVGTADIGIGTRMLSTTQGGQLAGAVGQTFDATKAQPIFTTYDGAHHPIGGVTLTLSPASGTQWYLSGSGVPTSSLSSTAAPGIAGATNMTAGGTFEVTATAPGKTCTPTFTVPGSTANSAVVEAIAGSLGEAMFTCL